MTKNNIKEYFSLTIDGIGDISSDQETKDAIIEILKNKGYIAGISSEYDWIDPFD